MSLISELIRIGFLILQMKILSQFGQDLILQMIITLKLAIKIARGDLIDILGINMGSVLRKTVLVNRLIMFM